MAANTRTATARTRTARAATKPARAAVAADEELEPLSDAEAQEMEATGHHITVELCGEPVRVVPSGAWRSSAQRKLRVGDLDGFMAAVLHEDDYDLYEDLDPTQAEFIQFVDDANELSGEPRGKSRGPQQSSRRTRRR